MDRLFCSPTGTRDIFHGQKTPHQNIRRYPAESCRAPENKETEIVQKHTSQHHYQTL